MAQPPHDLMLARPYLTGITLLAALGIASLQAGEPTVRGDWVEPSGAMIRIAPCDRGLCVQIVALPPRHHRALTDSRNPDPALRTRPLCGLRIGEGFTEHDSRRADGGRIYDPKSGRTYSSSMVAEGNLLKLRGYIGLQLFGRTETWTRASRAPGSCRK